jgi:hypothetical protein
MNKVKGGTLRGGLSLCVTCRAAHNVTGMNNQYLTICRIGPGPGFVVKFPVAECSSYDDKRIPSVWDMEKIAWEVRSRNRGPVGFKDEGRSLEVVISPPDPNRNNPQAPSTCGGENK